MAEITVQQVSLTGLSATFTAAASGGDEFSNSGKCVVFVKNGDSAAATVTVSSVDDCNQGFTHDAAVSVPAGSEIFIGPFNRARFNASDGNVDMDYSSIDDLTVAVVEVP